LVRSGLGLTKPLFEGTIVVYKVDDASYIGYPINFYGTTLYKRDEDISVLRHSFYVLITDSFSHHLREDAEF
jgi:hypothetical protein